MSLEDPFFVVKDEVCKALTKTRSLFQRWVELESGRGGSAGSIVNTPTGNSSLFAGTPISPTEELEWTSTELRNSLRSIEWDLEDLDETIGIVEKNPRKFKISTQELSSRKIFISTTREEVLCMKNRLASSERDCDNSNQFPTQDCTQVEIASGNPSTMSGKIMGGSGGGSTKYSRLVNQMDDSPSHSVGGGNMNSYQKTLLQQQHVMAQQDEQLEELSSSMSVLKQMSHQVGQEVDEQAVMLDDFGHEMDHTQSKMDNTLNKIGKVLHLTNDKRQWTVIIILSCILIGIILLFIIL